MSLSWTVGSLRRIVFVALAISTLSGCATLAYDGCPDVSHNADGVDITSASDAVVVGKVEDGGFGKYGIRRLRTLKSRGLELPDIFDVERETSFFEPTNDPIGTYVYLEVGTVSIMALRIIPASKNFPSVTYELLYGEACETTPVIGLHA